MFKISDFSKLSQVSMRTLRYYDEIGLLKPVHVDRDSGYRYYSAEQIPLLHRILAFKDLGFELSQIRQLLDEDVPAVQIRGMLRMKQIELQQRVRADQERLARVEARLQQIEMESTERTHDVMVKSVQPQIVAMSRKIVADMALKMQFANEMLVFLQQNNIKQIGDLLYIEHEHGEHENGVGSVEVAVPVNSASVGNIVERSGGRITVRELSGVKTMASLVYHGSPYQMMEAYQGLGMWIQEHDYTITGQCRKVCLCWEGALENYITELQFPVEKSEGEAVRAKRFLFSSTGNKGKESAHEYFAERG